MKKLISFFVLVTHLMLLATPTVVAAREKNTCFLKASSCIDGPSTKTINGVEITKECWEYRDEYECLEDDPADFCAPLKANDAKCEVVGQTCLQEENGECLRYTHQYSCDVDLKTLHNGTLPAQVTELEHTHLITDEWDTKACDAKGENCKVVSTECIEPGGTKVINGVPVTRECWKQQRTMQCSTGNDTNSCTELENNGSCTLTDNKCTHTLPDGTCQVRDKQFTCIDKPAGTKEVSSCEDQDFASTMTAMEMTRESQRYYDSTGQQFFKGEANKCSIKLGGALDSFMGGDCCQTDADPGSMVDFAVQQGTTMAAKYLLQSVASHYTYTTMFANAPQYLETAISAAEGMSTAVGGSGGIGAFGFTASMQGGQLTVAFDPVSFGIAIAIMALQQWLSCAQDEILTAMKRKADLCHYVGSYCGQEALGACVKKVESQCCYISKLAKIVNVGGREQLGRDWGTPENPSCEGFTAQELETIDFSKLDLSGFYDDIYANMGNVAKQAQNAASVAKQNIESGSNAVKNYYDE